MGQLIEKLLGFPPWLALVLIFLLPAAEASIFVGLVFPGELVILLGGVLANEHKLPLWAVIAVGSAGAVIGDSIGYEVGRHYGDRLLDRLPRRLVKPEHLDRGRDLLRRRGGRAVFIGRFTAALRALVPGLAGTSRIPYRSFLFFNMAGAVTWVVTTAVVGYLVGGSYRAAERRLSLISFGILAAVVGVVLYRVARRSERLRVWSRRRLSLLYRLDPILATALGALAAAGWLFGGLTQDVVDHDGVAVADPHLLADVVTRRSALLTPVARIVTGLGATPVVYTLIAITGGLVWWRTRRWQPLALALVVLAAGQAVRLAVDNAVGRPRPADVLHLAKAGGYAFPSGHTTTATIGYGLLAVLLTLLLPAARTMLVTGAAVVAVAVGLSGVYLGVHWPTDVLAGWGLGVAWLALAGVVFAVLRPRRRRLPEDRGGPDQVGEGSEIGMGEPTAADDERTGRGFR